MTEDKLCDREDYVEDQEIKLETRRTKMNNQQGSTGSERERNRRARKTG